MRDKTFNIAKNARYAGYQKGLASMIYKFLIKRLRLEQYKMRLCLIKNYLKNYTNQLLENFKKGKYTYIL